MGDRRYDDAEMAAIFRAAAGEEQPARQERREHESVGMTLHELQAIGREAGIAPDAIARAAAALDLRGTAYRRTVVGLPVGVGRVVELQRRLTDEEWERLVGRLRDTFDAFGRTRVEGSAREWRNGNLRVMLEPTSTGHRLRLSTMNANAQGMMGIGTVLTGLAGAIAVATGIAGTLGHSMPGVLFMGIAGLAVFAAGALRVPGWARLRARQMEALAAEAAAASESPEALRHLAPADE